MVVTGTSHVQGRIGTDSAMQSVEGTAPFEARVPFAVGDYVSADVMTEGGTAKIRVACKTVDEGTGHLLIWRVTRGWDPGDLPKGWPACPTK